MKVHKPEEDESNDDEDQEDGNTDDASNDSGLHRLSASQQSPSR